MGWGYDTEEFSNERKTIDVGKVVGLGVARAAVGAVLRSPGLDWCPQPSAAVSVGCKAPGCILPWTIALR